MNFAVFDRVLLLFFLNVAEYTNDNRSKYHANRLLVCVLKEESMAFVQIKSQKVHNS
jgi:hypothetical protein